MWMQQMRDLVMHACHDAWDDLDDEIVISHSDRT